MADWEPFRSHVKRNRRIYILSGGGILSKEKNMTKEKNMDRYYSVDDIQSLSYKEFKKNMERKVREDNQKAIEDEMKRPLFPEKNNHSTTLGDLWRKGMAKNDDPKDVQEEVDSLPDGGLYNVSIRFENMTPEVVSWLIGSMNSYIHMAREIKIEPVERDGE